MPTQTELKGYQEEVRVRDVYKKRDVMQATGAGIAQWLEHRTRD